MNSKEAIASLLSRLLQCSVFYIPNIEIEAQYEVFQDIPLDPYVQTLTYFTNQKNVEPFIFSKHLNKIVAKRHILDDLIFEITDFKDAFGKRKFNYLIEKYISWLNAVCYFSELMLNEIKIYFSKLDNNEYLAFEYQHHNFLEHRENIIKICNLKNVKPYSFEDIKLLSDVRSVNFKPDKDNDLSSEKAFEPTSQSNLTNEKEIGLPSNLEIEQFLLKTVFNINQV
ncbi:hypothetical protein [Patiriisocius marinus]|uniref:hypothetical protein n=1 Tax=Patiriisocius marinus TaxID=1397112 RepID=UPI00232A9F17|nr:hypothetical protein [Patiriisocius marinus]